MKALWLGLFLVGCGGGDAVSPDAAAPDAPAPDSDGCAVPLTGILTGLDGIPIANARLAISYDDARFAITDANGAFSLCPCVPTQYFLTLSLDAPGDFLDGEIYFELPSLVGQTIRTMTPAQAAALFAYDATRAQVIGMFAVDGTTLSLTADHDPVQTLDESGRYTLFPNVDPSGGAVTLQEGASLDPPGYGTREHNLDVAPGKLAFAVLAAPLE